MRIHVTSFLIQTKCARIAVLCGQTPRSFNPTHGNTTRHRTCTSYAYLPQTHDTHPTTHIHTIPTIPTIPIHASSPFSDILSPFVVLTTTMPSVDGVFTGVPTKTTTRYKSDPPPTIAITYSATALL